MMDGKFDNDIQAVVDADRAHVWHHLSQHKPYETSDPRIIVEGRGMRVWDQKGKEHIDAVSGGVWTVNVGYGRESIADAVRDALVKMCYFAGASGTVPGAIFADRLLAKMPGLSRVYYCNSGSEANEKAFKMIRQIAHKRYGGNNTRSCTETAITTAPPSARCRRAVRTSATRNTDPSRPVLSACRIVWSTAPPNRAHLSQTTANGPPTRSNR